MFEFEFVEKRVFISLVRISQFLISQNNKNNDSHVFFGLKHLTIGVTTAFSTLNASNANIPKYETKNTSNLTTMIHRYRHIQTDL